MYTAPHILVVDDEPLVALLIGDWLSELGYHVVGPVAKAPEAMRLLEETQLDGARQRLGHAAAPLFVPAGAGKAVRIRSDAGPGGPPVPRRSGDAHELAGPLNIR
jgi:CheY-like chemotaxis protein